MTSLSRLRLTTFEKEPTVPDRTQHRRAKVLAAIDVQHVVLDAAMNGTHLQVPTKKGTGTYTIPAWFVAQNGGYYVQCRYGARALLLDGKSNAVYARSLREVGVVLDAFAAAVNSGELDKAIAEVISRRRS
jgi:hypothetical protein